MHEDKDEDLVRVGGVIPDFLWVNTQLFVRTASLSVIADHCAVVKV